MTTVHETKIIKDRDNKKLLITREFNAPVEDVWKAWTDKDLLDMWWAPKPWKAETKSLDFREGGVWQYSMIGPDGTTQNCRFDYEKIVNLNSFTGVDAFCDTNGQVMNEMPRLEWNNLFTESSAGTKMEIEISFATVQELDKIIEMGFQQGFTAAHGNLDKLLGESV